MSDDLDAKIQQIAELLGQDKMPDNLKNLVSVLAGSLSGKDAGPAKSSEKGQTEEEQTEVLQTEVEQTEDEKAEQPANQDDSEMARKVKSLMDGMKAGNDPRVNLLHAIKPFMGDKRQKKIMTAIQLLQIASAAKIFNNNDK